MSGLPPVSVVVPTVDGREDHLDRCVRAYQAHAAGCYDLDLVVERNHPTCGHGWQAGLDRVRGCYVHFTCDDIEPHPGWAWPAIEAVERGYLPAPQVYGPHGQPQSHPVWGRAGTDWEPVYMTALPFVSREQLAKVAPLLTTQYFSDDWFSFRGALAGWPTRLRTGYSFTHWWAAHKRGAGMSEAGRLQYDAVLYAQAQQQARAGEWAEPWPPPEIARPHG